ncbi:hypothetical protein L1987_65159 [Smallanthus sonchifolius]|uniref:Uncharacterized protein n=1 Tax=Smallanthus sonchifolius TaxID=185202 RepID=A0ACB9BTJ6_9ASTR|nr:hypothetical protein L1987_65159 [Smallanthus sonchifolius]
MQKLRVTLEKVKQQNLQLAQSNSQMLAELNSVKERQKALNHEIGCKNGLIIAKNLELGGQLVNSLTHLLAHHMIHGAFMHFYFREKIKP